MKVIQNTRYWQAVVAVSSVGLMVLCAAILVPIYHDEMSAEAVLGEYTDSILTFTSSNSVASVSFEVGSKDGTFATSTEDEKARFAISTNNFAGYTLRISSASDDPSLRNVNDNTKFFDSIAVGTDSGSFQTNKWGLIPSSYYSGGVNVENNNYYFPAPSTLSNIGLAVTNGPNSVNGIDNADEYTIGIGLKADYTKPSGTYTNGAFVIEYTANVTPYNISFDCDTGDNSVADCPDSLSGSNVSSVTITNDKEPTRTGYTFAGKWCLGSTGNNGTTCDGTVYNVGDSFGIDRTENNNITLYAMWNPDLTISFAGSGVSSVKVCKVAGDCAGDDIKGIVTASGNSVAGLEYGSTYYLYPTFESGHELDGWSNMSGYGVLDYITDSANPSFTVGGGRGEIRITGREPVVCNPSGSSIDEIVCMQDINSSNKADILSTMTGNTSYVLYDSRDKTAYKVAKLADGNVWMQNNLALDLDNADVQDAMYDSADQNHNTGTNADNETLGYLFNGGGDTSDKYPTAKLNNEAWVSEEQNYFSIPMMVSSGVCDGDYCVNENSTWAYNDMTNVANTPYSSVKDKIGAYYNFCAASAGSYCYGDGVNAGSPSVEVASYDICPSGWHMPLDAGNGSYDTLYGYYSNNYSNFVAGINAPMSGLFKDGKAFDQGRYGIFLSNEYSVSLNLVRFLLIGNSYNGGILPHGANWVPNNRAYAYSVRCVLNN